MKCGLLPLSQESALIGDVSYHSYNGIVVDPIEGAFHVCTNTVAACDHQVKMMPLGIDNLVLIDDETRRKTFEIGQRGGGGVNTAKKEWAVGELEFEGLMRMLDNSGFRTGYTYIQPLERIEPARLANDVELPPTSSNLGWLMEEDELYKDSPLKGLLAQMARSSKGEKKGKWVNSPNVYQKVGVLETGTSDPKKITKWVSDGSPSHSHATKIENNNQFVPVNTNPKEFKKVQKLMKEGRRLGGVHAGPESKVLDGLSWEEVKNMQDAQPSQVDGYQGMKIGAASKGIIQRDFQHHATVFKSPYAKNPFDSVSNDELEEYKRIIDKKQRGETSPVIEDPGDTTDPGSRTCGDDEGETDGNRTFSEGEGDTSRATDPESALSPKKKKKGLRTPSFLKKKKKDKKEKDEKKKEKTPA